MNQLSTPPVVQPQPKVASTKSGGLFWKFLTISFLLLSMVSEQAHAVLKTFGTAYTTSSFYVGIHPASYQKTHSETIFYASEFGGGGLITSYALNKASGGTGTLDSVYIFMKESSATAIGTTVSLAGYTEVYRGNFPNSSSSGWMTATLASSFPYTGSGNLQVLVVRHSASTVSGGANYYISYNSSGGYSTGYRYSTSTTYWTGWAAATATAPSYTYNYYRPHAQMNINAFAGCTGTPSAGTAVADATTACPGQSVNFKITGGTLATSINYTWDTSSSASGPWTAAGTSTSLAGSWDFVPPSGRTLYYRCNATCSSGGSTVTSSTVSVSVGTALTVPYSETFESTTVGTEVACSKSLPQFTATTLHYGSPGYWKLLSGTYSTLSGDNHTPGGSKYMATGYNLSTYAGGPAGQWFTPGIALQSGKTYRFSFWHRLGQYMATSWSGGADYTVYYNTTQSTTGWTAIASTFNVSSATYNQATADFTVPADGVYNIAIQIHNKTYAYYNGGLIDDIGLVELPPCNTATAATFATGGKAAASPNVICSTPGSTTLSVSSTPAFSGLSFAWEMAAGTPTTFSAIAGASTATYSQTISSGGTYYFRCKVSCSSTGTFKYSDTVKVTTAPITPPYIEDFEGATAGSNLPCAGYTGSWSSGTYWYIQSAPYASYAPGITNHTTGGSKYLHAGYYLGYATGSPQYWFTPGLALTAAKAYEVSYWYSNSGYYPAYYSTYATDMGIYAGTSQSAAGMTISTGSDTTIYINATGTATYGQYKRGFVAPTTGTYYVGLKVNHKTYCYYGFAIDDIGIEQLPPCSAKPAAGKAKASPTLLCSSSSTSIISLDGLSVSSDLTFQWEESTTSATGPWSTISGATLSSYTTTTPATHKWYRCIVTCPIISAPNVDTSTVVEVKTTPITPPYFEDFESGVAGVNMPCASYTYSWSSGAYWYLQDGDFSTYYTAITNHTPGGSKYIHGGYYLGSYGSGSTEYWFTPALALTTKKAYNVSYWINGSAYSGGTTQTGVAVGTAQTKAAMTIAAGSDTNINTSTYLKINRAFISPTTGNYYVGIKVNNLTYSYPGVAIDDIGVDQLPPCSGKPSAGSISASPSMICSVGSTTLSLPGASMASDLDFQWFEVIAGVPTIIAGATSPAYTTPSLSASKSYICVLTCSASASPNTDTTPVFTIAVGALTPPYIETFEGATVGVNLPCASYTYGWSAIYWSIYGSPFSSAYPAVDNHTPGGAKYLRAGYYLGYYASGKHYWFSPAIKFTAGKTYEFSYWYSGSGYSGGKTNLGLYYGTSQSAGTMTAIIPDEIGVNTGTYKQLVGRFIAPTTGNRYLGVMVQHTGYAYSGMAIDDIGLEQLPDCSGTPTAGAISTAPTMLCSPGVVKLNMDLGGVSKVAGLVYDWYSSTTGTAPWTKLTGTPLTAPAYTTGTTSVTTYYQCVVKCTNTGDSTFSAIKKVDVGAITPPYIEDFETGTEGVNMPCASYTGSFGYYYYWNVMGSPMTYGASPLDNHTPGGSKYLIAGYNLGYSATSKPYWFTPAIKFTAGKLYQLSYWYASDGYVGTTYGIQAYMGTAQTAAAMTTAIGTSVVPTATYKQSKTQFTPTTSGNFYIGFQRSQINFGYGLTIDDIGLQEVPPCSAPVAAGTIFADPTHICAVGGTTVLDLSGSTLATGLTYKWLSSSSATGTFTTTSGTTLPYTTDPLVGDTWFKCVVTCSATGATDTSAAFKVGVGAFDLPYTEDFESTPSGQKPICSESTDTWGQPFLWNTMGAAYGAANNHTPSGKKYLLGGYYLGYYDYAYYGYTRTDNNFWFTPGLKLNARYKYQLSYWYNANNGTGQRMGVFYGRSQSVGAMTNTIVPFDKYTNTTYAQIDTTFKPASSGIYYLGFQKSSPASGTYSYPGLSIDDINLNYAPCDALPFSGEIMSTVASGTANCPGTIITLIDTGATINLVPGISYQWQRKPIGGAGPFVWSDVAGATDSVLKADTLIGYEYRFAVTCNNVSLTAYSAAYQLPAHPPHPAVSISPSITPIIYCLGDSIKFNATSFTGAVYDWMKDSVVVPGWKFSDFGATEPGTYFVRVSSALSPCPGFSNQVKLIVNDPGYSVDITTPTDSIICAGTSILLKATASKSGVTYQWRKDNVDIPGATGSNYLVTTGGHYRVMAYDGISTCQAASRNIKITVQPNPPAVLTIVNGTATACENEGVLLQANTGGFSYEWRRSGSPIVGWTDSSQLVKNSGIYSVKVRSIYGCVSISNSITVNILPSPVPVISKAGSVLSSTSTYVSYEWYRNGSPMTPSETNPTLNLTMNGYYKVRVKDANGCTGESNPIEIFEQGLGIKPTTAKDQIRIYPNPTQNLVNIDAPISVVVTVKDVTGRTIINATETKTIDMSKFADGVYLFMISDKDGNELIKQQRVNKITAK